MYLLDYFSVPLGLGGVLSFLIINNQIHHTECQLLFCHFAWLEFFLVQHWNKQSVSEKVGDICNWLHTGM